MENHHAINGKFHYFNGHFPWQNVSSPEGRANCVLPEGIPRYKAPRLANVMCPRLLRSRGLNLSPLGSLARRGSSRHFLCREWAHHIQRLDGFPLKETTMFHMTMFLRNCVASNLSELCMSKSGHPLRHWSSEQYWTQLPETHAKQVTLSWHWGLSENRVYPQL